VVPQPRARRPVQRQEARRLPRRLREADDRS
jgi:hypothetical protein